MTGDTGETAAPAAYSEDHVQTLSALVHIRTRPGMYIGRLGDGSHPDDGIYVLLKEVIDNSVDEFIMGAGRRIDISIAEDGTVEVVDQGRGIPLGKVVDCVSIINTGAKYNTDAFQYSVGLNGVGTKAVNALSAFFQVESRRGGRFKRATFAEGVLSGEEEGATDGRDGTTVRFRPSAALFPKFHFDMDYVRRRLWMYAYLNSGLSLYLNGERFLSRNGLKDLIDSEVGEERLYETIHFRDKTLEFALCHTSNYGENHWSFVNGQFTNDGGTHLSAFREGILKAVNEYAGKSFEGSDVRDGVVGAVAIKLKEPIFESQTKNKLGNTDIRGWIVNSVRQALADHLHRRPETARILLEKISLNEKVRRDIQQAKRQGRENAKKMAIKIPKLKDCKYHLGDRHPLGQNSMIFLTEGQSAAGSMVSSRNVDTQAIFSLKGKPVNCFGLGFDRIYQNEELYYIMQALGIERDIEGLRYAKVVIATDSDVDGLHIRNLLITFFLTYFEQLVLSGHVHILETPLFRVRGKSQTIYCYSEAERDSAARSLGGGASVEITRFKGLGEISPSEFGQFIGDNIRLVPVTVESMSDVHELLEFFMGANTPERREHIMANLV